MTKKTSKSKKVEEVEEIIEVPKKVNAPKVEEVSDDEHDSLSVEDSTSSGGEDGESSIDENALMQFFQQAGGMFGGNGGGAPPGTPHMQEFLTHEGESVTKVMVDIRGIMGALVFEFQKFNQNFDKFLQMKTVNVE